FSTKSSQSPGPGELALTPSTISFGNVPIGTRQTHSGSLTNAGGSSITVKQVTVNGTGYSVSGLAMPLTLAVGQSASFSVFFAPSSTGGTNANITFNTDASAAALTLSGMGVAPGDLATSPTSIGFSNVQLGSPLSQAETLKNTGSADLTVTAATVSGPGFSYTGLTLPLTLTPNQASTFGVSFTPATAGASSGSLSLTISGLTSPVDVALSGTGVAPATQTALPASLTFTNVQVGQSSTQTETVTNTGGSSAQISQVAASGTGFSISGISTPVTLTPGQSTSFNVAFTPHSAGNFSGSVSVTSNASNPNLNVSLTGSAVAAAQGTLTVTNPIGVGSVVDGLSGTQTATLTATGGDVLVSSVSLGGTDPGEFSISGLSFPITVTTSQPVSFTVTFTPSATGAASAGAAFASNSSNSPTVTTLTGTGTSAPVHSVQLSWIVGPSQTITSYNVYRAIYGLSSCGSYTVIGSTSGSITTYTDAVVSDGTIYCYATTAVDSTGESAFSNVVQATIPPP
ncbi:MAG: choice-of-anchor D domain-containing protein, partial [Terriglobales bacterium]